MEALDVYRWLIEGGTRGVPALTPRGFAEGSRRGRFKEPSQGSCLIDAFDAHVVASVVAVALVEAPGDGAKNDQAVVDALGLDSATLADFVGELFPHAATVFGRIASTGLVPSIAEDESCLRELLSRNSTSGTPFEQRLGAIVARRAQRPNHLWQDLGLRHRRELSWLMARHFEPLAARNSADMKWKKFLYRMICRDGGFLICAAPICSECSDFDGCFGDEPGETRLKHP